MVLTSLIRVESDFSPRTDPSARGHKGHMKVKSLTNPLQNRFQILDELVLREDSCDVHEPNMTSSSNNTGALQPHSQMQW